MVRQHVYATLVVLALLSIAAAAYDWFTPLPPDAQSNAQYVGGHTCAECHQPQVKLWHGSHHDRAMEIATDETVLGDFNDAKFERLGVVTRFFRRDGKFMVNTEGPDGQSHDYEITYTFGIDPLQQYMVEFPNGRVQVLRISWDTHNKQWFEVTPPDVPNERLIPGDPLHWTGVAQNWNSTCAECHSTNLEKNFDFATETFHTTYSEIDVSCEECHGPGSVHVELARRWSPLWDRNVGYGLAALKSADTRVEIEACAKCHSRRNMIHGDFRPGRPLLDYFEPALLSAGLYHDNGQILDEVYEYGSFLESKMHANHVRCTNCHDPHSLQLKFAGNRLCTQCHIAAKYDTIAHHHHPVDSAGAQCVACHMPMRTYMVIDERHDHSFRVPRPDLSVALGTPNACNDCHSLPFETPQWAADKVYQWYGPKRPDDPHWATAIAAANRGLPEGEQMLVELIGRVATPAIVKATALSLTPRYPTPDIVAAQQRALGSDDPLVRAAAVRALFAYQPYPEFVAKLGDRLTDRSRLVRLAAAQRLATVPREQLGEKYQSAFDKALDEYRASQQLNLERAAPHINLGSLAGQLGELKLAEEELRTAIRLEPYLAGPRTELARILAGQGEPGAHADEVRRLRTEEAEVLDRDATLLPESGDIRYRLGLMRYLLGELEAASTALAEACRLDRSNIDYRMALALLEERRYELDGEIAHFDAASASLDEMAKLRPNDPRAEQIRRRLHASRQQKEAATPPTPPTAN